MSKSTLIPSYDVSLPMQLALDPAIPSTAIRVYAVVRGFCHVNGRCAASNAYIADQLSTNEHSVSERTISRLISALCKAGYLEEHCQNVGGKTIRSLWLPEAVVLRQRRKNADILSADRQDKNVYAQPDRLDKNGEQLRLCNIPPIVPQVGQDGPAKKTRPKKDSGNRVIMDDEQEQMFKQFWAAYPRHENLQGARRAWVRLNPDQELLHLMLDAIMTLQQTLWQNVNAPHGSTFLNNRRWEDAEGIDNTDQEQGPDPDERVVWLE